MAAKKQKLNLVMVPSFPLDRITLFLDLSNNLAAQGHLITFLLPATARDKVAHLNEFPDLITLHWIDDDDAADQSLHHRQSVVNEPAFAGSFIARGVEVVEDVVTDLITMGRSRGARAPTDDQLWPILRKVKPMPDFVVYDELSQPKGLVSEIGFGSVVVEVLSVDSTLTLCIVPSMKTGPPAEGAAADNIIDHVSWRFHLPQPPDDGDAEVEPWPTSETPLGMEHGFSNYVEKHYGKLLVGDGLKREEDGEKWAAWLDKIPPGSVVYCAFGRDVVLGNNQFQELLKGFELCGRPCLVVRRLQLEGNTTSTTREEAIPKDLEEGVMMFYDEWQPQPQILNHPSVGCFVTDCELGSVWEALMSEHCQIVLIPDLGNLYVLPATLLTKELKVAVEVEKDEGWINKEKLRESIDMVMDGESEVGEQVKRHHLKLREGLVVGRILKNQSVELFASNLIHRAGSGGNFHWDGSPMPRFVLQKIWHKLRPCQQQVSWSRLLWQQTSIPRNSLLTWLIAIDRINTLDKIQKWQPAVLNRCPLCETEQETRNHLFFCCDYVQQVVRLVFPPQWNYSPQAGWQEGFDDAVNKLEKNEVGRLIWNLMVSELWRERCRRLYAKTKLEVAALIRRMRKVIQLKMAGDRKFADAIAVNPVWFVNRAEGS